MCLLIFVVFLCRLFSVFSSPYFFFSLFNVGFCCSPFDDSYLVDCTDAANNDDAPKDLWPNQIKKTHLHSTTTTTMTTTTTTTMEEKSEIKMRQRQGIKLEAHSVNETQRKYTQSKCFICFLGIDMFCCCFSSFRHLSWLWFGCRFSCICTVVVVVVFGRCYFLVVELLLLKCSRNVL